jgi:molybdopterin-guanine dinucleotide biosynthesis protein B
MFRMKPIVSIVGRTNSGKTTLIEKLIPELKKRGYKVGVIKHTKHQFEIDHPGKDTWRMTKAGADTVVIASDKKLAMIRITNNEPITTNLDELVEWLFPDVDIVITEGYKRENKPKIEVTRSGELLCNTRYDNLLAVVFNPSRTTNYQTLISSLNVPCFSFDEISAIVDFIINKYGSRNI